MEVDRPILPFVDPLVLSGEFLKDSHGQNVITPIRYNRGWYASQSLAGG